MKPTPKRYVYITRSKTGNRNWLVRYKNKHRSATAATFDAWRYDYPDVLHWVNSQGVYILILPPDQRRELQKKRNEESNKAVKMMDARNKADAILNERRRDRHVIP